MFHVQFMSQKRSSNSKYLKWNKEDSFIAITGVSSIWSKINMNSSASLILSWMDRNQMGENSPVTFDSVRSGGEGDWSFALDCTPHSCPGHKPSWHNHHSTVFKVRDTQPRFKPWPSPCSFNQFLHHSVFQFLICKNVIKIAFQWGFNEMVWVRCLRYSEYLRNMLIYYCHLVIFT